MREEIGETIANFCGIFVGVRMATGEGGLIA
jgi:hypothetical protein